jgi:predicted short-subunit dehydrogenase-like oxidoreductase (DUF2520 family)
MAGQHSLSGLVEQGDGDLQDLAQTISQQFEQNPTTCQNQSVRKQLALVLGRERAHEILDRLQLRLQETKDRL